MNEASHERRRRLRPEEIALIAKLLKTDSTKSAFRAVCSDYHVQEMSDGGMGSVRFLAPFDANRRFGDEIAKAEYVDQDGVMVSITINADQHGDLYELDFWKTNFSPLIRYPEPSHLRIID
jgi:hypothetical protein